MMAADPAPSDPFVASLRHRRLWFIAAFVFVLVRSIPNIVYPIARDQATYLVIGQSLLEGQHLYQDVWDNKPPGIFFLFALIVKLFDHAMWCVGLVDILWLLAISYCIFRFTERYLGSAAAAIAVATNATWHVWAGYWEAAQTETFLMLFVFVSYFLVAREGRWVRSRHFAAGLFFGAAFWLKYNAVMFLPFIAILPYLDFQGLDRAPRRVRLVIPWRQWFSRVALVGVGWALTVVVVLGHFWLAGAWEALKEVQFEVLPLYSRMALERTPDYPLWAINQTEFVLGPPTEIATLVALVLAWRLRDLARFAPVLLSVAMGYACVALQVRFHAYGFETAFPFFAMAWGYLGVKLFQGFHVVARGCLARGWRLARVLVWVVFANVILWPVPEQVVNIGVHYQALGHWWRERDVFYAGYPWPNPISHFPDQIRVINYLRSHLQPEDGVFVWGSEPLIYFLTRRPCPTRFVSNLALISPWSPPAWRIEMVEDLRKAPPRYLVVARDDAVPAISYTRWDSEEFLNVYPEFTIFIADYYQPEEDLENFVIYRRREIRPGPAVAVGAASSQK